MEAKKKECKGNYRSNHFDGCGEMVYRFKYGLCQDCFRKWVLSTPEGGKHLHKQIIPQAKKEVTSKRKKETQAKKINLLSKDGYRKKYLQPVINEIARIIDNGQPCIANENQKVTDGGHFISTGSNRQTALNLHNIHGQSRNSNSFQGGEDLKYYKGLIKRYGQEYADFCDSLRQSKAKHTKQDYIEAFKRAKAFRLAISKKNAIYDNQHRIELRNQGNQFIGLYELKYSQFKIK